MLDLTTEEKLKIEENASIAVGVTTAITILALGLALIFIFNYSRHFTKPFIEMNEVMEKIADLDFSERTDIERRDEVGTLAENINRVADSLDEALTELREKNDKLLKDLTLAALKVSQFIYGDHECADSSIE